MMGNYLTLPKDLLTIYAHMKKIDLLCKNPGFQDSPTAMSRTCNIALKAPLETSYSALAGLSCFGKLLPVAIVKQILVWQSVFLS